MGAFAVSASTRNRRTGRIFAYVGVMLFSATAVMAARPGITGPPARPPQAGKDRLYLGNGGYWRQRVRIEIRSGLDRDAAGEPVEVRIGGRAGEADLVGTPAEAVRVCDAAGVEMLYRITAPTGEDIVRGPIPEGGILTVPAECPAGGSATYYAYYDNPAAWEAPDFLEASLGVRNGGVEAGMGDAPFGWNHDAGDEQHRALWVAESPYSGKRCLKIAVAPGAEPTWIATRQRDLHITGGARYVMRAWVKAENVDGYAGWYVHVGNEDNSMLVSPMLDGGGGTYDWKQVTAEFTAPQEADRADLGTVLRGTGTAWFDDVALESDASARRLTATASEPEKLELREIGADAPWYDENAGDDVYWDCRAPVRVMNFAGRAANALVQADISAVTARFRGRLNPNSIRVTDGTKLVPCYTFEDTMLFDGDVPARAARTYYVYFSLDKRIRADGAVSYEKLVNSGRNLARNPSFERGAKAPAEWSGGAEGQAPPGAVLRLDQPGLFGSRCAQIRIPRGAGLAWTGWRQDVPVAPGKTYLYAAWAKSERIEGGSVMIYAHYRNAAGELCASQQHASAGPEVSGTHDWTLMHGCFEMPPDIATFQLHLTMHATGTLWHDGVLLAEVMEGAVGGIEGRAPQGGAEVTVWPVNAVVKVFRDDPPPRGIAPARISAARNEQEPLQLAVRSSRALNQVTVEVEPPAGPGDARLTQVSVGVVGYVPIDHKTAYYSSDSPSWHRKYPTAAGSCDGWPGMWPDPILPQAHFDLPAGTTQPIWITVNVPKGAGAGDYAGRVRFISGGATLAEVPFSVRVWDFALPDETHLAAIYDARVGGRWSQPGKSPKETREELWRFMAERRVCPDRIEPSPEIRYENGKVVADFAEFDRAAEYYFDVLKLPMTYTPDYFYLFGWGYPPAAVFGEQPYEGEYPYQGADRAKLRPEYKRAYQACLKAYWEHMKAKGWDRKCALYISDEPYYEQPPIREQMKALCDMIHEVDPEIPIYCSTWHHRPEWDGYLDIWGIGHYGIVTPEKMAKLRAAGDRLWFTTDGQMCTDTPYCGVERLLPHYCFKYGVEAYEFWGVSWLTYDPYRFGWHAYIRQAGEPGDYTWVRYPNGDGYLAYPGAPVGHDGPVSSVRLEQAREGVEDYEYLYLLRALVAQARAAGKDTSGAEKALAAADDLVEIPNAGGRYSSRILPDPDAVLRVKEAVARAIEGLR